ncbi:arylsulfatase [Aquisalinus flavus]|uniref:Arylsulfatase n=2 Tax=Aquisalinus flavus TaxID=1526572 RepID=A0A8J2Y7J4_9PROT|nr:arylsulfatase [Aquisalinus flavus]
MTGMDNHQVGMGTLVESTTDEMRKFPAYSMAWEDDQETIATLLSDAGYQTYVTGKWGIGEVGGNLPNRFGFDRSFVMDATGGGNYDAKPYLPGSHSVEWFEDGRPVTLPEDWYSSRSLVDKMIEYIDQGDSEEPFYAFLALQALHMPIQVSAEYTDRYNGVFDAGWDVMRQQRLERVKSLGLVPDTTTLAPQPESHRAWDDLTPKERKVSAREMQVNAGMMENADYHIGRLINYLETQGLLENTIIMIASDNGPESAMTSFEGPLNIALDAVKIIERFDTSYENLGEPRSLTAIGPEWASVSATPFDLYKFYASEGGLRVPLVVAGPGIADSGVEQAPVHVADITPTLLDAANVDYDPAAFYGRSVLPMLAGETDMTRDGDDTFAFEVSGNAALYRGQWKITRNAPPMGDSQWRLYDLSVDPGETTDLAGQNPELFESMLAEYQAYSETVGAIELGPDDNALKVVNQKLVNNMLHKYWPHATGFVLAVLLALFLLFKLVRGLSRRAGA